MSRPVTALVVLTLAALVGLLAYGLTSNGTDRTIESQLAAGERVDPPLARLPKLGGSGTGEIDDYAGKVVLVNFWGSWCDPCKEELPLLQRTQERIAGQGGMVLGVTEQEPSAESMQAVRDFKLSYPHLRDRDGSYAREFGATSFPETFVLDREGRIAASYRGPVDQEWIDETLPPLLAEGQGS